MNVAAISASRFLEGIWRIKLQRLIRLSVSAEVSTTGWTKKFFFFCAVGRWRRWLSCTFCIVSPGMRRYVIMETNNKQINKSAGTAAADSSVTDESDPVGWPNYCWWRIVWLHQFGLTRRVHLHLTLSAIWLDFGRPACRYCSYIVAHRDCELRSQVHHNNNYCEMSVS